MSLSGLDDVKIKEAHEAAIVEPGGWFLLKYVSRDEVDLLGHGNGGIVEVRNAISTFDGDSPLFGLLRYRRRNVLIKYVPESCSRLIQARVTVHFSSIVERFSPHDTIFSITSPTEFKDSTLSAACSLHTASGSTTSSTSSLRKRRLIEIAEDAEEDTRRQSTDREEHSATPKDTIISSPQVPQSSAPSTLQSPDLSSIHQSGVAGSEITTTLSHRSQSISNGGSGSPKHSFDGSRKSFQSSRPENYSYSLYGSNGRPKIRLGPRPSIDMNGRPHTSASVNYRPISTLPAGLKLFSKNSKRQKEQVHEQSGVARVQHPKTPPTMTFTPPMDSSTISQQTAILTRQRPHTSGGQPAGSGTPVKPPTSPMTATPQMPTLTPEKMRLLKALEMRKKQKNATSQTDSTPAAITDTHSPSSIEGNVALTSTPQVAEDSLSPPNSMLKNDSAIAIEAFSVGISVESDTTKTNSNPASPLELSEESHSTRASSISDSTDETVQGQNSTQSNECTELPIPTEKSGTSETYVNDPVKRVVKTNLEKTQIDLIQVSAVHSPSGGERGKGDVSNSDAEASLATQNKLRLHTSNLDGDGKLDQSVESRGQESAQDRLMEGESITNESVGAHQTPKTPIRESKIPRSKFSVQDLKLEAAETSSTVDMASTVGPTVLDDAKNSNIGDEGSHRSLMKSRKRKCAVDPIRTDVGASERNEQNSETELSSDDDLMDELQSATVEEAKPISVSKSPITPVFPRRPTLETNGGSRAFSNPMANDSLNKQSLSLHIPSDTPRSVSSYPAFPTHADPQPTVSIAKKVSLGTGISQRIKVFEKLSGSQKLPPGDTGSARGPSPSLILAQNPGSRGSKSPSIIERAESLTRKSPSPSMSREPSPEAFKLSGRSETIQSRREAFKLPSTGQAQRSRPESISVTARIVRDPNQPFPLRPEMSKDAPDYIPLDLKQSPLLIDHQKAIIIPQSFPNGETQGNSSKRSKEQRRERRSSITIVKDLINERRSSFAERRKSMTIDTPMQSPAPSPSRTPSHPPKRPLSVSSRRSNSSREFGRSLSPVGLSINSSPTNSEETMEKKPSRATRILRRMSSSFSVGRKSIAHAISPTVREEFEPPQAECQDLNPQASKPPVTPSVTIDVGDLNVQFPDTLLWKRRRMTIDSQGFLLLSQAHGNKVGERSIGLKKYHLSEFRAPLVPEMEAQELPNSVVLDFLGGGGLQVACEDRGGQIRVLQVLQEAHRAWASYGK